MTYRYKLTSTQLMKVLELTQPVTNFDRKLDIYCGYSGFASEKKFGYSCRIRSVDGKLFLEVKNASTRPSEISLPLKKLMDGINFIKALGMKAYLFIDSSQDIRATEDFHIAIDSIKTLGNFLKIEFDENNTAEKIAISKFLAKIHITKLPVRFYAEQIETKLKTDKAYLKEFKETLESILKN